MKTQKGTAAAPIRLEAADYWELRSRIRDIESVEYDLLKERQAGLKRLEDARALCAAVLDRLSKKYTLPELMAFGWNDATHELTPQTPPTPP